MQMRMQMQVLSPGVEHGEEADGGAEESRVGGGFKQRLGSRAEQEVINLARVLKHGVSEAPLLCESKYYGNWYGNRLAVTICVNTKTLLVSHRNQRCFV